MDAIGKGTQRNIAERVVEEMADQIGEQHQSAGETDLPDADAANEFFELGPVLFGHADPSNNTIDHDSRGLIPWLACFPASTRTMIETVLRS